MCGKLLSIPRQFQLRTRKMEDQVYFRNKLTRIKGEINFFRFKYFSVVSGLIGTVGSGHPNYNEMMCRQRCLSAVR